MNKSKKILYVISFLLTLSSCNNNPTSSIVNEPYQDIKDVIADKEFSFETTLMDKVEKYPLSKGNIYYVSASGDDSNDGLSQDNPLKTFDAINKLNLVASAIFYSPFF